MRRPTPLLLCSFAVVLAAASQFTFARPAPQAGLTPFRSEKEMLAYFKKLSEEVRPGWQGGGYSGLEEVAVTGSRVAASVSVTNTQHAGVDEGDIVKQYGDYLVMLRRGRLFTVNIGMGRLRPVSAVNAYGPGINPDSAWYDELLVSDGTVVVIGYNYDAGATEVGLFDISDDGRLRYRATYHFHSEDYYSSRNYASRLIGTKLIFYTPLYLGFSLDDPLEGFPPCAAGRARKPRRSSGPSSVTARSIRRRCRFGVVTM